MDRLTQFTERSRRHALRLTLGGMAVAAAGLAPSGRGAVARKTRKKRKKQGGDPCQCVGQGFSNPCLSYADCCTTTTNLVCGRSVNPHDPGLQCLGGLGFPCSLPAACAVGFTCNGTSCQPEA